MFQFYVGARTSVLESRGAERGCRVAGLRVLVRALSRRGAVVGGLGVVEGGLFLHLGHVLGLRRPGPSGSP